LEDWSTGRKADERPHNLCHLCGLTENKKYGASLAPASPSVVFIFEI